MKTIKHNGKTLKISAFDERCLRRIAISPCLRGELTEGRGNFKRSAYLDDLPGVACYYQKCEYINAPKWVRDYAARHFPRAEYVYYDDKGKVKRLVAKLDKAK